MSENDNQGWMFRFFISEQTAKTQQALKILGEICKTHLKAECEIEVVDISKDPRASVEENIIATPTLIRKRPEPVRRIIGEFSDKEQILAAFQISQEE